MPLPWKKPKPGRISRFVSDFQQSPKHGGSLVVETGFPTSLIDLFVKNRDRLKKSSSKRSNNSKSQNQSPSHPPRPRVSSPPPPPTSLQRRQSCPPKLDPSSVTEEPAASSKIDESIVGGGDGAENKHHDDGGRSGGGGGCCVLMVVAVKVFVVAVLALSTKKLAVGITLSAFSLLFLELAVARVFRLFNICPDAQARIDSLIGKFIGKGDKQNPEEASSSSTRERKTMVSFDIIEEPRDCSKEIRAPPIEKKEDLDKAKSVVVAEERPVQTIRDVVFNNKNEKSKSAKLKSKIVKKIVPKKLRSYKKKKKLMKIKKEEEVEEIEIIGGGEEDDDEEEEEGSVTEVSSLYSEERIESEISERDDVSSNPPFLESCEEIEEEEEESGSKGDVTKAIAMIVIVLAGLLVGKVLAIGLTLSWCLILKAFCCKSQTSL